MPIDPKLEDFARSQVARQARGSRATRVDALQVYVHHAVLLVTVEPSSRRVVFKAAGPGDQRSIDYERTARVMA
jgi:hypothetical protein